MHRFAPVCLAGLLLLGGCTTVQFGRDFDIGGFDADVRIGETDRTGDGKLGNLSAARFKLLQVRFDASGKVKTYNWSE